MTLRPGILLIIALLTPILASASQTSSDILLDGNDIDLLVGAPAGVAEPLDTRRTRVTPGNLYDYSGLLDEDFQSEASFADLDWSDAEEQPVDEEKAEAQFLDLVSETDELESIETDDNAKTEVNSFDSVETNSQL
ncbi:MAG TPA: hypothetical protein PLM07_11115 [Candidatus Rifleibacterium sp.]|nr:hypothetical protein [Candidatus Rifleibacterium sp.]HPT46442.1 hypothetical protein [Candidatus Rifleibacterium sp.]